MPDLTSVFRATVQDLSQASGNMSGVRSPNLTTAHTTKSTPDPWLKEAHQIVCGLQYCTGAVHIACFTCTPGPQEFTLPATCFHETHS